MVLLESTLLVHVEKEKSLVSQGLQGILSTQTRGRTGMDCSTGV